MAKIIKTRKVFVKYMQRFFRKLFFFFFFYIFQNRLVYNTFSSSRQENGFRWSGSTERKVPVSIRPCELYESIYIVCRSTVPGIRARNT